MDNKTSESFSSKIYLLISFLIPTFIMIVICIVQNITPFGDITLLISDASNQYIDYFSYLKTIYKGENNFFYTLSKNLGGDMVGMTAYYLLSPFNIILLFFSEAKIASAFTVILIAKLSACGLTFNYFAQHMGYKNYNSLIFSTAYALIGYNTAYFFDIMWLDGVLILPIIILGIEYILQGKKSYLYIFSLSYALFTNYYIGYMICIFTVLYITYKLALQINSYEQFKEKRKYIITYIISSITSAGLVAFLLISTFLSLSGTKASTSLSVLKFGENFEWEDFFNKFLTGTMDIQQYKTGEPNVYVGMLILILVIFYFLNKKISTKEKVVSSLFILALLVSFYINTLNIIWHGFNAPSWFPYRYSFVFSFLLIYLAMRTYNSLNDIIAKIPFVTIAFVTILLFFNSSSYYVYLDILAIFIFGILLYMISKNTNNKNRKRTLSIFLIIIHSCTLLVATNSSIKNLSVDHSATKFSESITIHESVINTVQEMDTSVYRLETTFHRSRNDSMQFDYNGLSHFSSCEKTFVKTFLGDMGIRNNGNWADYVSGTTVSAESLLGLKYILTEDEENKDYLLYDTYEDINIFENQYVLPLAFLTSSDVVFSYDSSESNPFTIQNEIWDSMVSPIDEDIFIKSDIVEISAENVNETIKDDGSIYYSKIDSSEDAYIHYDITISSTDRIYLYLTAPSTQNAELYINGEYNSAYFNTYLWNVIDLGTYEIGDTIQASIKLTGSALTVTDSFFYYEDLDILESYRNYIMNDNDYDLQEISSSKYEIDVNVTEENQYLTFSIPYETDWNVYIDGESVEYEKAFDTLLTVSVPQGEHTVTIRYIPKGFVLGSIISIFTALSLISYILYPKFRKRKAKA